MRRWSLAVAILLAIALGACRELLGGLDEGVAPTEPSAGERDASSDSGTCLEPWLEAYPYRAPIDVENRSGSRLLGYSLAFALDTKTLVATGKARPNGSDLRVAVGDGTELAPHWIASRFGGEATTIWAKLDLAPGRNRLFVYYGSADGAAPPAPRATFLDGIVGNAAFDDGTLPWTSTAPSGGQYSLAMGDGRAAITFAQDGVMTPTNLGFCQLVRFPSGSAYRLVFDVTITEARDVVPTISVGGLDGPALWASDLATGVYRGASTVAAIDGGDRLLCLGARVGAQAAAAPGKKRVQVSFEDIRVRLFADPEPIAAAAGAEVRCDPSRP